MLHLIFVAIIAITSFRISDHTIESSKAKEVIIDGNLNDSDWNQAQVLTGFTQFSPDPGQPATEKTEVRILYDDNYLYVGIRCRMYNSFVRSKSDYMVN